MKQPSLGNHTKLDTVGLPEASWKGIFLKAFLKLRKSHSLSLHTAWFSECTLIALTLAILCMSFILPGKF